MIKFVGINDFENMNSIAHVYKQYISTDLLFLWRFQLKSIITLVTIPNEISYASVTVEFMLLFNI